MADARAVVIDARLWVRNPISIVISSAIASAALGARHKMGPPSSPGRMTGRVGFSKKGVSPVHFSAQRRPTTQGEWDEAAVIISPFAQDLLHHLDSIEWWPHTVWSQVRHVRGIIARSRVVDDLPQPGETLPASQVGEGLTVGTGTLSERPTVMPVPPGAGIRLDRWLRLGFRLRHNARTDLRVVRPTALGGIGRAGQAQGSSADDPGCHSLAALCSGRRGEQCLCSFREFSCQSRVFMCSVGLSGPAITVPPRTRLYVGRIGGEADGLVVHRSGEAGTAGIE